MGKQEGTGEEKRGNTQAETGIAKSLSKIIGCLSGFDRDDDLGRVNE